MARSRRNREDPPERRNAFRFPVSGPRRDGSLQVGGRRFGVTIVDESAGGFAVEFNHLADCQVGDVLLLRVIEDWFKVRVAFLEMQDVGVERFTGCELTSHTRLGLTRLIDEEYRGAFPKQHWFHFRRPRVTLRQNSMFAAAILIVVGLSGVGGILMRMMDGSKPLNPFSDDGSEAVVANIKDPLVLAPKIGMELEREGRKQLRSIETVASSPPVRPGYKPSSSQSASRPAPQPNEKSVRKPLKPLIPSLPEGLLKKPAASAASAAENLIPAIIHPPEILRLAHPHVLLRPEIAKKLSLTHTQQVQLRRMLVEQRTADSSLSKALTDDHPDLVLGRRSIGILTSQQQHALVKLQEKLPIGATPRAGSTP